MATYIKVGYGPAVAYTIDGNYIKEGYGPTVAYTIDGNYIKEGYGPTVAYTIDGNYIKVGYGPAVAYTIDGNYIKESYGPTVAYTIDYSSAGGYSGGGGNGRSYKKQSSSVAKFFGFVLSTIIAAVGMAGLLYMCSELRAYDFNLIANILFYGCVITTGISLLKSVFKREDFKSIALTVLGWDAAAFIAIIICGFILNF